MNPTEDLIGKSIRWVAYSSYTENPITIFDNLSLGLSDGTTLIISGRPGYHINVERYKDEEKTYHRQTAQG